MFGRPSWRTGRRSVGTPTRFLDLLKRASETYHEQAASIVRNDRFLTVKTRQKKEPPERSQAQPMRLKANHVPHRAGSGKGKQEGERETVFGKPSVRREFCTENRLCIFCTTGRPKQDRRDDFPSQAKKETIRPWTYDPAPLTYVQSLQTAAICFQHSVV